MLEDADPGAHAQELGVHERRAELGKRVGIQIEYP
jgi:hypothetical protein